MQDLHSIRALFFGVGGGATTLSGDLLSLRGHVPPPPHRHQQPPIKCPRCESTNTKFCYYNNYNLSQPRHFCKSCRRYWTRGGVLRNIPVGGASRKSSSKKPSSSKKNPNPVSSATDPIPPLNPDPNSDPPAIVTEILAEEEIGNRAVTAERGAGGELYPGIFEYWNQSGQWEVADPSLFLP